MKTSLRAVLFLVGIPLVVANPCAWAHTDVTPEQARDLIDSTDDLVVVDVREPFEYCDTVGHIPGALNYPLGTGVLEARYEELSLDAPVLVVCRSGNRSNQAANFLDSKGFSMVYDMMGGMNAWQWETELCKYSGGSGTADDPYQIATAADLIALGETPDDYDKHFKLMADIDLSGYSYNRAVIAPDVGGDGYTFPATPFTGVFDGNRHAVLNLTIVGKSYLGLFGQVGPGGQVHGLGVVHVDLTGSYYAIGGLVGDNRRGRIARCYSTGTVRGYTFVGGLVGYNNYGDVATSYSTCAASATFSGNQNIGGLAGLNAGRITTCYSTGAVSGQRRVGGLAGRTTDLIAMCYSTGTVSGDQDIGGLVGVRDPDYGIVIECFWDIETSGLASSAGGIGKATGEMRAASTFVGAGWDFVDEIENGTDDIWKIWDAYDYPRLQWELGPNTPLVFVDINDPGFCGQMSQYEVTNAQYCDFLNTALVSGDITVKGTEVEGASGSHRGADYVGQRYYRGDGSGWTGAGANNGGASRIHYSAGAFSVDEDFGNHPVTYVSWYGAMAFCHYYNYHLPTEDQWQAVADYDGTYIYGCGETIDPGMANYRSSVYPDGTIAVGSLGRYGYGMSDMAGNVWEWASSGSDSSRIFRGGGWYSYDDDCAVSIRGDGIPHANYCDIGFRVCR